MLRLSWSKKVNETVGKVGVNRGRSDAPLVWLYPHCDPGRNWTSDSGGPRHEMWSEAGQHELEAYEGNRVIDSAAVLLGTSTTRRSGVAC
jgi:hypothetical protein